MIAQVTKTHIFMAIMLTMAAKVSPQLPWLFTKIRTYFYGCYDDQSNQNKPMVAEVGIFWTTFDP